MLQKVDSGFLQKEAILSRIHEEIDSYDVEQLRVLEHAMKALKKSKEQGFHFLGHFLGIEWLTENESILYLGSHNANRYGKAQGGVLYTLADVTIARPIISKLPKTDHVYTLEMKINYIKQGQGNYLRAKGNILYFGKKTVVGECSILDEAGDLVAKAMGTFYIARNRNLEMRNEGIE